MDIKTVGNTSTQQIPKKTYSLKPFQKENVIGDKFQKAGNSENLDADRMKSMQTGKGKETRRASSATRLIPIGAMFAGIITGAAIGGPFAPALMISMGALFGGAAILALR